MSTAWNVAPPLKANRELAFKTSLLASVFSGLIFASPAWAQEPVAQSGASADAGAPDVMGNANGATEADASAQAANVGGMEEIVVTAQKRSESLQKVPIAISALGTEALETRGFDNLSSLSKLSPSIQLSNFGPIAFVTLRGIGNENSTAGGDPGVAFHYDGIYIGRPVGTLFSAFDTERVEILRGPQGTLYGRNATGGSVNYITKKPSFTFEGNADLTVGNYDMWRVRGAINVPLSDRLSTRLVAFREKRDGFTENSVVGGTNANDANNYGFRGHVLFEPTKSLSILLSGTFIHSGGVGSQAELRTPYPGSTTGQNIGGPPIPGTNNYLVGGVPLVNDLRPFREGKDIAEFQRNELQLYSANIEWDAGPVTARSITGYVRPTFNTLQDADFSPKNLGALNLVEQAKQFSQEFQLLSNAAGSAPFTWIVGAFYFHEKASRESRFLGGRYQTIATANQVPYGFLIGGDVEAESYAAFGQATFRPMDKLGITGGLRYTHDEKRGRNRGFQFAPPAYNGPVQGSWQRVTYRLAADYQVTPDILTYASYSTGYKSGGVNQAINPARGNAVYDPEFVKAIEVGVKSRLFDRRLQVNTSLFRNKYDDLQFTVFGPLGPQAFNAEGATVQGIELEIQGAPTDWLQFDASGAYTDATFDTQILQGVQLGGKRVQRTPEWTANIGASILLPLGSAGDLRFRMDYSYTSSIFYTAFNRNAAFPNPAGSDLAPSYSNVDLRVFYRSPEKRWTGEIFATNVFDTAQVGNLFRGIGFTDVVGGGGPELVSYRPPRMYGVRVAFAF